MVALTSLAQVVALSSLAQVVALASLVQVVALSPLAQVVALVWAYCHSVPCSGTCGSLGWPWWCNP